MSRSGSQCWNSENTGKFTESHREERHWHPHPWSPGLAAKQQSVVGEGGREAKKTYLGSELSSATFSPVTLSLVTESLFLQLQNENNQTSLRFVVSTGWDNIYASHVWHSTCTVRVNQLAKHKSYSASSLEKEAWLFLIASWEPRRDLQISIKLDG